MIFEIEKPLFGTMIIEQGLFIVVWQKNKPPARQVEGVALASSKKPPVII